MTPQPTFFQKLAKRAITLSLVFCVAIFLTPAAAFADTKTPNIPVFPCGSSPGAVNECNFYKEMDKKLSSMEGVITMALVMAALNAFTYMTQQLAEATAQFILHGGKGGLAQYYPKTYEGFLADVGTQAMNSFVSDMQDYVKQATKFNICAPFGLQALDIQLSIGIQKKLWPQKPLNCSFQQFTKNIEASAASLETTDLFANVKKSLNTSGSDLGVTLKFQELALLKEKTAIDAATLNRQENGGLKPIANLITGNIKTPAQEVKNTLAETNRIKLKNDASKLTISGIANNAFQIGIYQLPAIFGSTLLNSLAVGGLEALKKALTGTSATDDLGTAQLINPFAQPSAEVVKRSTSFTDIVTPNLMTTADQDFVHELSSCPTPRGLWGCAMDDGFAAGLRSFNDNGAFSTARAAGIGTDGKGLVFLHPDWELIPETEAKDNQDPGCYQRAYCASNLAKLRFARIIPIGWELAANSPFNSKKSGKFVTLGEAIRGFNDCNDKGQSDSTHPWCKLVDPSWVLTAPPFQCRVKGFGDSVFPGQYPLRLQECSDVISCIQRDNRGQCTGGYGYCLSEKTVWRFDADACLERFVSCRTYQARNKSQVLGGAIPSDVFGGDKVSFIRNTIDYGSCNADNVGCAYYATTRDTSVTSTDQWVGSITPAVVAKSGTPPVVAVGPTLSGSRVYFDATVQTCDAANDGCTKVLKVRPQESSLNLVKNASFENLKKDDAKKFDAWDLSVAAYPEISSTAYVGTQGPDFKGGGSVQQTVAIAPSRSYVISFYARADEDSLKVKSVTGPSASVGVLLQKADGSAVSTAKAYYRNPTTCSKTSDAKSVYAGASGLTADWTRFTCEFVTNADAALGTVVVNGTDSVIDGVQLEEANAVTPFTGSENSSLEADHIKLPPEELACTGAKTDRAECSKYAKMCAQTDAGCKGYTDVNAADQIEIPASLSPSDLCPTECVGYAEYRKFASAFDLIHSSVDMLDDPEDATSSYFVPSSADQCTAADVGCESFTNVEAATAGGETNLSFNYIRACQKPNDDSTTYFTWEGSDTTGYQLRTWSLVRDNSFSPKPLPPKILMKAGPEGFVKDPATCTEAAWKLGADPDCRQIYDEKGNVFYKFFSQTIASSPQCQNYRKDNSDLADCTKTGGTFNKTTTECIYPILASQSRMCSAAATGCRAYLGTTGRNTSSIYYEKFSVGTSTGAFLAGVPGVALTASTESLTVGDHSLKIAPAPSGPTSLSVKLPFQSSTGTLYTLSFWAKTTDGGRKPVAIIVDGTTVGSVVPLSDWGRFEVGPFTATSMPKSTIVWSGIPNATYLDEVSIRRIQDVVYVRRDSWTVPASCDQTAEGIPQPKAMLGCRIYKERAGTLVAARQFSKLCRYDVIGCTAYVDTRNSTDPYAQSFAFKGMDAPRADGKSWDSLYAGTVTTTRPADRFVYAIDEPSAHCDAAMESCRSFGKPKFNPDLTLPKTGAFETVYLKDDITKYVDAGGEPSMLCRPSELFCEQFSSQTPTGPVVSYFRDPANHSCEWRDKVTVTAGATYPAGQYSGWFVKASEPPVPCYPEKISKGNTFITEYSGAVGYRGWTDTCPEDQAECTEFRDPNDSSDQSHVSGKPYFFINNTKLDKESCAGQVDLLSGCVLFRDMTDSRVLYSTTATYGKSSAENASAETPINCDSDPTNPYCKGRCTDLRMSATAGFEGEAGVFIKKTTNAVCSAAADCGVTTITCGAGVTPVTCAESDIACRKATVCGAESTTSWTFNWSVSGTCLKNDSNVIVKVKLDRDCSTWLGCSSGETVFDSAQGKYVDICTNLAVCDEALGSSKNQFCAHYVDRSLSSSPTLSAPVTTRGFEQVLREGSFISALSYAKREIGFGKADYSGYTIPNHFQLADMQTRRVGYELLSNRPDVIRNRFVNDFRLVASVPLIKDKTITGWSDLPSGGGMSTWYASARGFLEKTQPLQYAYRILDPRFPFLNLCTHVQTKQVGYFVGDLNHNPTETDPKCYFSLDTPNSENMTIAGYDGSSNPRNAQVLYQLFEQSLNARENNDLTRAFPFPECKANPDVSAPFPSSIVKEWDLVSDPPKPATYVGGYENVPVCEYGEDCSCAYKKVSFGGKSKYYAPYSSSQPAGICEGGSRDGQACVPDAAVESSSSSSTVGEASQITSNNTCGQAGICQQAGTVSLVRGLFGQCIQRDESRVGVGGPNSAPCLVWNPQPILFGKNDIYHYQPQAGYLPPQNSGEYYCLSGAIPPRSIRAPAGNGSDKGFFSAEKNIDESGGWIIPPGGIPENQFFYDDRFVSDGDCFLCSGNEGYLLDSNLAKGGDMGTWCEAADNNQAGGGLSVGATVAAGLTGGASLVATGVGAGGPGRDNNAGRWISTGRGDSANYAEYFIGMNPDPWARFIYQLPSGQAPTDQQKRDALLERNFAFFQFSPISNPNGRGRLGCGYTPDWVDGVTIDDYGSLDQTKKGSEAWMSAFNRDFKQYLTPEIQDVLRADSGDPIKIPCQPLLAGETKGYGDTTSKCYYKYWQIGYHDEGQKEFVMQSGGSPVAFTKNIVHAEQSKATKAFFAIRAMFEDTNRDENKLDPKTVGSKLGGPFRFVGWWITASVPGTSSERAIYMYLNMGSADICRSVAQVISPDSREATPFMDRIWQKGGYNIPDLGFTYNSTNSPFGSAMHTKPIGVSPLYQTHGKLPGVTSKNPPSFIASGVEYFRAAPTPSANWAWITNIFARVYRVYKYSDHGVDETSWACLGGPNFAAWCPTDTTDAAVVEKYCGYSGVCNPALAATRPPSLGRCNALSGVNAGLSCSGDVSNPTQGYYTCSKAPMKRIGGELTPLYKACELARNEWFGNWFKSTSGATDGLYYCAGTACPHALVYGSDGIALASSVYYKPFGSGLAFHPLKDGDYHYDANDGTGPVVFSAKVGVDVPLATTYFSDAKYQCQKGSVVPANRSPLGTATPGDFMYNLADCSAEATESEECPQEVFGGPSSSAPSGDLSSQCVSGKCSNGFDVACTVDSDCEFTWRQTEGGASYKGGNSIPDESKDFAESGGLGTLQSYAWWASKPGGMAQTQPGVGDKGTKDMPWLDIGGFDLMGLNPKSKPAGAFLLCPKDSSLQRSPGAYAASIMFHAFRSYTDRAGIAQSCTNASEYIAAHCELPPQVSKYATNPYAASRLIGGGTTKETAVSGVCEGGLYDGRSCGSPKDCTPTDAEKIYGTPVCGPVSTVSGGTYYPVDACKSPILAGYKGATNACVHPPGYYVRPELCGNDSTRSQCLTSLAQNNETSYDPRKTPPPTDVTSGSYTPDFLSGFKKSFDQDYTYISYYTPRPPTIAAPDTTRQCPSSGTCPISKVNAFTFENQTEGTVPYVGGQAVATIQFYGWAADNQAPLKDLWLDWGDGKTQEIHSAQMKNKKPYCGGTKECQLSPGLTCNSDADCPAGGGKCSDVGTCRSKPSSVCFSDADCAVGSKKDKCDIRLTFGNSELDCEQNYFSFTHAYACGVEARATLPTCGFSGRCGRNNAIVCTTASAATVCGPADKCVIGAAQPGGCFDATHAACRFTPRVLLKDNWGWCTGECRVQAVSGKLKGGFDGVLGTRTLTNNILLNNGGCYDGSRTYQNTDPTKIFESASKITNMCDPGSRDPVYSPWIVYPGAMQLGITQ